VGGFTPVLLHEPGHDPVCDIAELLDAYVAAAPRSWCWRGNRLDGYDSRPQLDQDGWKTCWPTSIASTRPPGPRIRAVLHPHVGTMIEKGDEVAGCSTGRQSRCVWTPVTCSSVGTRSVGAGSHCRDRITHTHLKDVHATTRTGAVR